MDIRCAYTKESLEEFAEEIPSEFRERFLDVVERVDFTTSADGERVCEEEQLDTAFEGTRLRCFKYFFKEKIRGVIQEKLAAA